MFGQVRSKIGRLRGEFPGGNAASTSESEAGDGNEATPDQRTSSRLFRCPSCEAVYIARTKDACKTCDTEVTRIRSTLQGRSDPTAGSAAQD